MANTATSMNAADAIYGATAECYITIGEKRYNFMQLTEFESKWDVNIVDVPILGKVGMGHKAAGGKGTWSGTAHYNQSVFRNLALDYQQTGNMPYFIIQTSNEDPTSQAGRQTIIHEGCLSDSFILSKFQAGEEILDEDLSGTFEDFIISDTFKDPTAN